jgi:hypothetical protein
LFATLLCQLVFDIFLSGDDLMNIVKLIQSHKELRELPFLVVYRTLSVLQCMGILRITDEMIENVEKAQ